MTTNHAVRKTPRMWEIEVEMHGEISKIILTALASCATDAAAATAIHVDPSTLNLWIIRLGLTIDAHHARQQR